MKTLYISCDMGAAGDMLTAALLELCENKEQALQELNMLNIPHVEFKAESTEKCGIKGTYMSVLIDGKQEDEDMHEHEHHHHHEHDHDHDHHHHDHEHHHDHSHNDMHSISHIVNDHINVNDKVKKDILNVYNTIAKAESEVHGVEIDKIHFHEVGNMDAIADIAAVSYLIDKLNIDKIICSPIHVGKGTVKCAHGILPVPAPATANILKGIPVYSKANIDGELCTPTGAALLKYYCDSFESMPGMVIDKVGYGMGKKDFVQANCVRMMIGDSLDKTNQIVELSCNVDDMTGEEIAYATNILLENGALDVFTVAINMKKNRPGIMIHVVCNEQSKQDIIKLLFNHTSTIGIRESIKNRYVLDRQLVENDTAFGKVRIKRSSGYGVNKEKYEYDDIEKIAKQQNLSIREVIRKLKED